MIPEDVNPNTPHDVNQVEDDGEGGGAERKVKDVNEFGRKPSTLLWRAVALSPQHPRAPPSRRTGAPISCPAFSFPAEIQRCNHRRARMPAEESSQRRASSLPATFP